jgi:ubiquinone/menaquinone biosynthesis C-methylase UbiE
MADREDTSTRSWNAIADDWVAHADTNDYRNHYLMPRLLAMVGDVAGRAVLDLGCGEGGYARQLAGRSARVTGVDGSERLIEVARQRARDERLDVRFVCANASALDMFEAAAFDLVVAPMSLMDVEDYPRAIREAHRLLRPAGALVMSIMHPCFSAPTSEWIRESTGALRYFAVDRYFDRVAWDDHVTPAFHAPVVRRHRPLEDYVMAPLECGFLLRELREPSVTGDELKLSPRFQRLARIPYFLFLRWQKPSAA